MRGTLKKALFFSVCFALALSAVFAQAQETTNEESSILPIAEDIENFSADELLITPAPTEIIEPVIEEEPADEAKIQEIINEDTETTAEDLGVSDPIILPGNPLYFAKTWWRNIRSATTFNPVKKAELRLQHANEKIIEAKKLAEESDNSSRLETAINNYQEELDKIQERVDIIKETNAGEDNKERLENFLDKFTDNQIKQQKVFNTIAKNGSEGLTEKILVIKENALEKLANIPLQFEEPEQFRERLENKMESQAGSAFKNFKNLEVLKEVATKVPEPAKEAIQQAQENTLRRLENTMNTLEDKERNQFKYYVEKIGGNEIRHIEIMHDFEMLEMPMEVRIEINQAKEKIFNTIQSGEIKEKMIEHLQDGKIENIRIIKELENNLPAETIEKVIEIKTKTMENFRKEIENSDNPDVQVNLMANMQEFHDVKQLEMFKEMEQYIPEDKKEFWEQMKTKAKEEMQQKFQVEGTIEEKMRRTQALAGDSIDHIKILKESSLPPEMINSIMQEQMGNINLKINYIDHPEKLQIIRENIGKEEIIRNEMQKYQPQMMQKINTKEDVLFQDMNKEKVEAQINKAIHMQQKMDDAIFNAEQNTKNAIATENNFQSNNIMIQDKLNFAKQALEKGDYRAAFEMSNTVIDRASENKQIMQNTKLGKDFEKRDTMIIEQEKEQKRENLNQLQEKLNNASAVEERQIREQIQKHQEIIQKLEATDGTNVGDKLQIIREEQKREQSNTGGDGTGVCTMDWNPVCGKDGNTYSNLCVANNKGAQIDYFGECKRQNYPMPTTPPQPTEPPVKTENIQNVMPITEPKPIYNEPVGGEPVNPPVPVIEQKPAGFIDIMMPFITWAF